MERLNILVIEDKAPVYTSKFQEPVFISIDILRLIWCGNSPDLNMIEPCWIWMKRETTKKGALRTRKEAEQAWTKCWEDLSQARI